mgnify:CR=1 FL=1
MSDDKDKVEIFEDEKKILLDHDYDGIRELDNPLPNWWVTTFALTVAFAIPYYLAHTFFGAQSINEELAEDVKVVEAKQSSFEAKQGGFNVAEYEAYLQNPNAAKVGKKTYKRKCKACHGKFGEGGVGPNLTDNFWVNGDGSLESVYKIIDKGVVDKGMAAWGQTLGKEKVFAVLKYVMDFKGTKPEGAKEPQGQEY